MKLKVLKRFHDKVTGEAYEVGSIIEPTNERGAELLAAKGDLVEMIDLKRTFRLKSQKPKRRSR